MIPKIRGWFEFLFFDERRKHRRPVSGGTPGEVVAECDDVYLVTAELDNVFALAVEISDGFLVVEQEAVYKVTAEIENVFGLVVEELPI